MPRTTLLLAAACTLPAALVAQSFSQSASFALPSPFEPRGLAVADLNGDGLPDLIAPGGGTGSVHVALGLGGGSYAAPVAFAVGTYPFEVLATDLNSDGAPDLVVANRDSDDVSILLGDGTGSFGTAVQHPVGVGPRTIRHGDLDGNGSPDLVVANFSSATVTVLLSDGAGGVASNTSYAMRVSPHGVALGDLNGDGLLDIVATSRSNQVLSVRLNVGAGGFGARADFAATRADDVALADFNGDGALDAVFANTTGSVGFVAGNGAGGFGTETLYATGSGTALRVMVGDLDADGDLDFVSCNGNDDLSFYSGDGAGNFAAAQLISAGGGASVNNFAIHDVDLDGYDDLVVASRSNRQVRVLRNQTTPPTGITLYGTGTPSCGGALGISSRNPQVGNANFAVHTTNSPVDALGLFLLGGPQNLAGFDPAGIGALVHLGPGLISTALMTSDCAGLGRAAVAIPNNASLGGLVFYVQGAFLQDPAAGETCSTSSLGVVTSKALEIIIQP